MTPHLPCKFYINNKMYLTKKKQIAVRIVHCALWKSMLIIYCLLQFCWRYYWLSQTHCYCFRARNAAHITNDNTNQFYFFRVAVYARSLVIAISMCDADAPIDAYKNLNTNYAIPLFYIWSSTSESDWFVDFTIINKQEWNRIEF